MIAPFQSASLARALANQSPATVRAARPSRAPSAATEIHNRGSMMLGVRANKARVYYSRRCAVIASASCSISLA